MTLSTRPAIQTVLCTLGMALAQTSGAQSISGHDAGTPAAPQQSFRWALGSTIDNGASYAGSERRSTGASPIIGLAMGRYTLSSGGGGTLLDRDLEKRDTGLSTHLLESGNLRLTGALRWGGGRSPGDEPRLQGLPEIRSTLRGRLGVVYDVTEQLSLRSAINQDLLGRGGGALVNNTLRYEIPPLAGVDIALIAGAHWANAVYMRNYFGVPAQASSPLPRFAAGAGWHSTEVGFDWRKNLHAHWVLLGGVRYSQLHGDARQSPLTTQPHNYSVSVGLAYRY